MKRRDFIKMAACAGLGIITPVIDPKLGFGEETFQPYQGTFFAMFKATGGWDTTSICDPKGDINGINKYKSDDIQSAGNIAYAPFANNQSFFDTYYKDLLVLNGIDMSTNSHNPGKRYAWTGRLANTNYPTFGAMIAAIHGPKLPLPYLSFGGYSSTGDIVTASRISKHEHLKNIANADYLNANPQTPYHSTYAQKRIQQALEERYQAYLQKQHLPRVRKNLGTLFTARVGAKALKRIVDHLPITMPKDNLQQQITIALAAYKAGLCVSVTLSSGNFDSHNDNDLHQAAQLPKLLSGVDFMLTQADRMGIREKILTVIGSDFARTPHYNKDDGKDHWSVGSMMLMGQGIKGNRVVGATDKDQKAKMIDHTTLEVTDDSQSGKRLRPEHIHRELRKIAGITNTEFDTLFPLDREDEEIPTLFQG